jgi:hypothetical protein
MSFEPIGENLDVTILGDLTPRIRYIEKNPKPEPTEDKLAEIAEAKKTWFDTPKPLPLPGYEYQNLVIGNRAGKSALGPMLIAGKKGEFTIVDEPIEPEIELIAEDEYPIRHGKPDLVSWCAKLLKVPEPTLKRGYFSHYAEAVPGEITVNCPPDSLPRVIFHEMAHQWQFEHGLVITENSGFYRGVETPIKPYWWAPWEIEARGMEDAILHEWGKCTRKKRSKHLKRTLARLLMS